MQDHDKYAIGTPEMQRKQREVDARVDRITRHPMMKSLAFALLLASGMGLGVLAGIANRNEILAERAAKEEKAAAEREAWLQAERELEAACVNQGGSLVVLGFHSPTLCLADDLVFFNVPGVTSDDARKITGAPDPGEVRQ